MFYSCRMVCFIFFDVLFYFVLIRIWYRVFVFLWLFVCIVSVVSMSLVVGLVLFCWIVNFSVDFVFFGLFNFRSNLVCRWYRNVEFFWLLICCCMCVRSGVYVKGFLVVYVFVICFESVIVEVGVFLGMKNGLSGESLCLVCSLSVEVMVVLFFCC